MKNGDSKLRIYRTSTSPYFPADFNQREKETLEKCLRTSAELVSSAPFDVLITNTHTDFSQFSEKDLKNLKLIIHPNSGYDNFSASLVQKLQAPVVIGHNIRAQAVSQYILSGLYSRYIGIPHQRTWDQGRQWPRKLLSSLKITIIGYGHIGKILHAALLAQGCSLTVIDPYQNLSGDPAGSDVVILACGLNESSRHLVDKHFLKKMPADFTLINAARGELVKTDDLIEFLSSHEKAHAVLDVFEVEPGEFALFHSLTNVTTTSHIAGVYSGIDQATINFEKDVLQDFFEGQSFEKKYQNMLLKNRLTDKGLI